MPAKPFVIPDFTVSTSSAVVLHVKTNGSISEVLLKEHDAAVNAIATHPSLTQLVIGSYSCKLKLWDYQTKWDITNCCTHFSWLPFWKFKYYDMSSSKPNVSQIKISILSCCCREVLSVRNFNEGNYIQCVTFDPKGHFIGMLIDESFPAIIRQSFVFPIGPLAHRSWFHKWSG